MTINLAKLRAETLALIDGTTPGPWVYSEHNTPGHFWITPEQGYLPPPLYLNVSGPISEGNARLIAAAPALAGTILRLLDEIERLKAEVEQLREAAKPFSDAMQYIDPEDQDDYAPSWAQFFTIADFRRITAALAKGGPDDR